MADPIFSFDNLIGQVTGSLNQSNAALAQTAKELTGIADTQEGLFKSSQETMSGAVTSAALLAGKRAATEFKQNKMIETTQRLYGLDPDSQNFAIAENMNIYNKAKADRAPVREKYNKLSQVSLLDNPLGWIIAQLELPQVAAQNNALADTEDEALADIQARQQAQQLSKSTLVANTSDEIQANQLEEAALKATVAHAELDQNAAKNLAVVASTRLQAAQLLEKRGDNTRQAIGVIAQIQTKEETRLARIQAREDAAPGKMYQQLILKEKLEEIEGKAAEKSRYQARLADISNSLGLPIPMTIDILKTAPKKDQELWHDAVMSSGYGAELEGATRFFLSKNNLKGMENASVRDLATKLEQNGVKYVPAERAKLTPVATSAGKGAPSDVEIRNAAYNSYADAQIRAMVKEDAPDDLSSSRWDHTLNVYVAPFVGLSKAIDTNPQLAGLKNNIIKKEIDTLLAAGTVKGGNLNSDQAKQVMLAAQNLVTTGYFPPQHVAAQVKEFMDMASRYNLSMNKYNLFGLPEQNNYMFTIPGGNRVDLMDPVKLENELTRVATHQRALNANMTNPYMFRGVSAP